MSLAKKKYVESAKKRVREKLAIIQEQHSSILSYVSGLTQQAELESTELLEMTNKKHFMQRFIPVMQHLEECQNKLFIIQASLPEGEFGVSEAESDDSEESDSSSLTVTSVATSNFSSVTTQAHRNPDKLSKKARAHTSGPQLADSKLGPGDSQQRQPSQESENSSGSLEGTSAGDACVQESSSMHLKSDNLSVSGVGVKAAAVPSNFQSLPTSNPPQSLLPLTAHQTTLPQTSSLPSTGPTSSLPLGSVSSPHSESAALAETPQVGIFVQRLAELKQAGATEIPVEMRQLLQQLLIEIPDESSMHQQTLPNILSLSANPRQLPTTLPSPLSPGALNTQRDSRAGTSSNSEPKELQAAVKQSGPMPNIATIPEDYGLGPAIPQMSLAAGKLVDVLVIEVEDPWLFWMQPINPDLEDLNAALESYHKRLQPTDSGFQLSVEPSAGMVVTACFNDGTWYRACVTAVYDLSSGDGSQPGFGIEVFYVDFGNREILMDPQRIRPLPADFTRLPCQVIPGALSGLGPPDGGVVWANEQRLAFAQAVSEKQLSASIEMLPPCPLVFTKLFLFDGSSTQETDSATACDIGREMLQGKYAKVVQNRFIVQCFSQQGLPANIPKVPVKSRMMPQELVAAAAPCFTLTRVCQTAHDCPDDGGQPCVEGKSHYGTTPKSPSNPAPLGSPVAATGSQNDVKRESSRYRYPSSDSSLASKSSSGGSTPKSSAESKTKRPGRGRGATVRRYGPSQNASRSSSKDPPKPGSGEARNHGPQSSSVGPDAGPDHQKSVSGQSLSSASGPDAKTSSIWSDPNRPVNRDNYRQRSLPPVDHSHMSRYDRSDKSRSETPTLSSDKLESQRNKGHEFSPDQTQRQSSGNYLPVAPRFPVDSQSNRSHNVQVGSKPRPRLHNESKLPPGTGRDRGPSHSQAASSQDFRNKAFKSHQEHGGHSGGKPDNSASSFPRSQSKNPTQTNVDKRTLNQSSSSSKPCSYSYSNRWKAYSKRPPPEDKSLGFDSWEAVAFDSSNIVDDSLDMWEESSSQSRPTCQGDTYVDKKNNQSLASGKAKSTSNTTKMDQKAATHDTSFEADLSRAMKIRDAAITEHAHMESLESLDLDQELQPDTTGTPQQEPKLGMLDTPQQEPQLGTPDTPQQRLKSYGLPSKLPSSCQYKDTFEAWLNEEESHVTSECKDDNIDNKESDNPAGTPSESSHCTNSGQIADAKPCQKTDESVQSRNEPAHVEPGEITDVELSQNTDAEPGQKADAEPGQKADAEPGQKADAAPGQEADVEPGKVTDAESGQNKDAESSQGTDTESGRNTNTEPGQSTDAAADQSTGGEPGQQMDAACGKNTDTKSDKISSASVEKVEAVEEEVGVEKDETVEEEVGVEKVEAVEEEVGVEKDKAVEEEVGVEKDETVEEEVGVEKDETVEEEVGVVNDEAVEEEVGVEKVEAVEEEVGVEKVEAVEEEVGVEKDKAVEEEVGVEKVEAVEEEISVETDEAVEEEFGVEKNEAVEEEVGVEKDETVEEEVGVETDGVVEEEVGVEKDETVEEEVGVETDGAVEEAVGVEKDETVEEAVGVEKDETGEEAVDVEKDETVVEEVGVEKDETVEEEVSVEKDETVEEEVGVEKDETVEEEVSVEKDEAVDEEVGVEKDEKDETARKGVVSSEKEEPVLEEVSSKEEELGLEEVNSEKEENIQEEVSNKKDETAVEELSIEQDEALQEDLCIEKDDTVQEEISVEKDEPQQEKVSSEDKTMQEEVSSEKEKPVQEEVSNEKDETVKKLSIEKDVTVVEELSIEKDGALEGKVGNEKDDTVQEEVNVEKDEPEEVSSEKVKILQEDVTIEKDDIVQEEVSIEANRTVQEEVSIRKDGTQQGVVNIKKDETVQGEVDIKEDGLVVEEVGITRDEHLQEDDAVHDVCSIEKDERVTEEASIEKDEAVVNLVSDKPVGTTSTSIDLTAPVGAGVDKAEGVISEEASNIAAIKPHPSPAVSAPVMSGLELPTLEVVIPEDSCLRFLMSHIESPSSFYIHPVIEGINSVMDGLMVQLQKHFTNDKGDIWRRFLEPEPQSLCVARYSGDNELYRGQVIHTGSGERHGQVEVFFVDFGNREWTSRENVYPLPPEFRGTPFQAIHCCLDAVVPVEMKSSDATNSWADLALNAFEMLTGYEKTLLGYVNEDPSTTLRFNMSSDPLPLVVVDATGMDDVWVNVEMVRQGHAVVAGKMEDQTTTGTIIELCKEGSSGARKKSDDDGGFPDSWDPMREDYESMRNAYDIDTTDPGVALVGYHARDEERICKFFAKGQACWRGQYCTFEHVRSNPNVVTTDQVEVVCMDGVEGTVELPENRTWVAVEITAVHNPAHFYVSFPFGAKPLQDLMREDFGNDEGYAGSTTGETWESLKEGMNDYYNKHTFSDRDLIVTGLGEIVAVKYEEDNSWYRARCIDNDPDSNRIKVFYLDFGNSEWVEERRVRRMKLTFMHVPFQAVECYLAIDATTEDGAWTKHARDCFMDLIDGRVLIAQVLCKHGNGTLTVELYDTTDDEVCITDLLVQKGLAQPAADLASLAKWNTSDSGGSDYDSTTKTQMIPG